jgi:hypothetical protein
LIDRERVVWAIYSNQKDFLDLFKLILILFFQSKEHLREVAHRHIEPLSGESLSRSNKVSIKILAALSKQMDKSRLEASPTLKIFPYLPEELVFSKLIVRRIKRKQRVEVWPRDFNFLVIYRSFVLLGVMS